jgi:hypothetical protein
MIETFSPSMKNIGVSLIFKKTWGSKRKLPKFKESFNQRWKKNHKF